MGFNIITWRATVAVAFAFLGWVFFPQLAEYGREQREIAYAVLFVVAAFIAIPSFWKHEYRTDLLIPFVVLLVLAILTEPNRTSLPVVLFGVVVLFSAVNTITRITEGFELASLSERWAKRHDPSFFESLQEQQKGAGSKKSASRSSSKKSASGGPSK